MILSNLKADEDSLDFSGKTPLNLAVENDAPATINFLISHGASTRKHPYIYKAIASGKMKSLIALLENGLPPNYFYDEIDITPMEVAIQHDLPEAMEILVAFGAKQVNNKGKSLLYQSVSMGSPKAIVWFIDKGSDIEIDELGNNILHEAVKLQKIQSVKAIMSRSNKVDVDGKNDEGITPVTLAVDTPNCGYAAIAEELIKNGADVEQKGWNKKCSPLIEAAYHNCTETFNVILSYGADINKRCLNGNTALIFASFHGNYAIAKKLIDMGAELDIKGQHEETALHAAAPEGHVDIVKELLHHGASTTVLNHERQTPSDLARARGYEYVAELIDFHDAFY